MYNFYKNRYKLLYFFIIIYYLIINNNFIILADELIEYDFNKILISKYLTSLKFGTNQEKVISANVLGQDKALYVRPLCDALLSNLEEVKLLNKISDEPYAKVSIALALGRIGHPYAINCLGKALDQSIIISQKQIELYKAQIITKTNNEVTKKDKNEISYYGNEKVKIIDIIPEKTGPFISSQELNFNNADNFWSPSDMFKGNIDFFSSKNVANKINYSFNWMNVVRAIISAMVEINDRKAVNLIIKFLDSTKYNDYIRYYVILAIGELGGKKGLSTLEQKEVCETSNLVKVACICSKIKNNLNSKNDYKDIIDILKNGSQSERLLAANTFVDLKMGSALQDLKAALELEDNELVRYQLIKAIQFAEIDSITNKQRKY